MTQNHQYFEMFLFLYAIFQSWQHVFWILKNVVLLATLMQKLKNFRDFSKFYFFQIFLMVLMENTVSSCFEVFLFYQNFGIFMIPSWNFGRPDTALSQGFFAPGCKFLSIFWRYFFKNHQEKTRKNDESYFPDCP